MTKDELRELYKELNIVSHRKKQITAILRKQGKDGLELLNPLAAYIAQNFTGKFCRLYSSGVRGNYYYINNITLEQSNRNKLTISAVTLPELYSMSFLINIPKEYDAEKISMDSVKHIIAELPLAEAGKLLDSVIVHQKEQLVLREEKCKKFAKEHNIPINF